MEKILRKYTTIPNHLYVERNADKQLKNIIEEMERPGYVSLYLVKWVRLIFYLMLYVNLKIKTEFLHMLICQIF